MKAKLKGSCACSAESVEVRNWNVESLVSVDERGQMVLSKALREKAGIKPGDKLAVATWERNGKVCCISLIMAGEFSGMIDELLGKEPKGAKKGK